MDKDSTTDPSEQLDIIHERKSRLEQKRSSRKSMEAIVASNLRRRQDLMERGSELLAELKLQKENPNSDLNQFKGVVDNQEQMQLLINKIKKQGDSYQKWLQKKQELLIQQQASEPKQSGMPELSENEQSSKKDDVGNQTAKIAWKITRFDTI